MIGSEILSKAYRLTNKSATTFLDGNSTNIYKDLNTCYGNRVLDILNVRVDKNATIENATTTLYSVSNLAEGSAGYNGEYAFPSDLVKPSRVEISYDGITWVKATIYDNALNTGSEFNDTQISSDFSQSKPVVDFTRNSFKIRPVKTTSGDISNGIYIEYEKRQADFSSSGEPVEIEKNLQDILAFDLASLEFIMHADRYTDKHILIFERQKAASELRFFKFYKNNISPRMELTVSYNDYR